MEKQLQDLEVQLKRLEFTRTKTDTVIGKRNTEGIERQRDALRIITKEVENFKVSIEQGKFAAGEQVADIATWSHNVEEQQAAADDDIVRLENCLTDARQEAVGIMKENEEKLLAKSRQAQLEFEKAQLELKMGYEKKPNDEATGEVGGVSNKNVSGYTNAKLPKLVITKFNGDYTDWQRFWSQFEAEIDRASVAGVTKFSYLKELVEPSVRATIDGLPFSTEGYERAKNILKDRVNKQRLLDFDNPRYQDCISNHAHLVGVEMQDTDTKERLPVHLILGASDYAKIKTKTVPKIGAPGEPIAEQTKFGWTMMSPGKEVDLSPMFVAQTSTTDYENLCRLDVLGLQDFPEGDQNQVYTEFKEQLVRSPEGWYETGLPWKGNHPPLHNNEAGSLRRLHSLERKLEKQGLTEKYHNIIQEQLEAGIVERVTDPPNGREFYIPHKAVVREAAESTKLRVVYDASARAYDNATSLNECLNPGPPLQNQLWNVLVRARFHPVAITGDIKQAFLQVRIQPANQTKRGILGKVARIYDPLGLTSPVTLGGKLLYRDACDVKLAWDAELPTEVSSKWSKWEESLPDKITVPRSIATHQEEIEEVELHAFGDASGKGVCAAAVYAVIKQPTGVNQGLVAAKARLAKRGLTIPRLELVSGHMAVNLLTNVSAALDGFSISSRHGWLDSSVALHWIRGQGQYKQFVSNRVQKIQDHPEITWHHVSTKDNPADVGSRSGKVSEHTLWWKGPPWLTDKKLWPPDITTTATAESQTEAKALREVFAVAVAEPDALDALLQRSDYWRAMRVCGWVMRFIQNARATKAHRVRGPLTTREIETARLVWVKRAQASASGSDQFEEDKLQLNLQPNSEGVLECRGRIQGEYPVFLPDNQLYTQKVVMDAHLTTLHGGMGLTMAKVRQQHWVPRLRRLTKRIVKSCHGCRRFQAQAYATPPPGNLPTDRTEGETPFQVIGVDYAGPIKGLFLELLPNMETTEFLGSLKRLIARRGRPKKIYSDNGRTFIGAAKWIKQVMRDERVQDFLAQQQIHWQFNLSRAPWWWGGQFERMVGLVKAALYKTIGNGMLSWKELQEVILDVETHHVQDYDLRNRAKHLLKCKNALWSRWTTEYLRSLREQHRLKHKGANNHPNEGEVVIIKSDEKNRGKWKLGIVDKLIVGKDGRDEAGTDRERTRITLSSIQHKRDEAGTDRERTRITLSSTQHKRDEAGTDRERTRITLSSTQHKRDEAGTDREKTCITLSSTQHKRDEAGTDREKTCITLSSTQHKRDEAGTDRERTRITVSSTQHKRDEAGTDRERTRITLSSTQHKRDEAGTRPSDRERTRITLSSTQHKRDEAGTDRERTRITLSSTQHKRDEAGTDRERTRITLSSIQHKRDEAGTDRERTRTTLSSTQHKRDEAGTDRERTCITLSSTQHKRDEAGTDRERTRITLSSTQHKRDEAGTDRERTRITLSSTQHKRDEAGTDRERTRITLSSIHNTRGMRAGTDRERTCITLSSTQHKRDEAGTDRERTRITLSSTQHKRDEAGTDRERTCITLSSTLTTQEG
ncbi:hypothetical protein QZH41_005950 [Actinostola sp. cb2023]|nr:hypothetical protein QZH41_005950 [Actinostola sp. cb2023]